MIEARVINADSTAKKDMYGVVSFVVLPRKGERVSVEALQGKKPRMHDTLTVTEVRHYPSATDGTPEVWIWISEFPGRYS